jgi:ferric-dicitrate binding protein FerR (iron transport regulator)
MDERDDIATLVRLAGKRDEVSSSRAERVRAATRAHWRQAVRRRAWKPYAWVAAGLTTAAAVGALAITLRLLPLGGGPPAPDSVLPLVESLAGSAWREDIDGAGPRAHPLAIGERLPLGTEISTAAGSGIAIRLASGHSLRLDGSTSLRLLEPTSVALGRGALYVDSGFGAAPARSLAVRTSLGLVREVGTQFELRLDGDSLRVRLREGAVVVHRGERDHEVRSGTELELQPDGSVARRTIPAHGPEWDWMVGITPMLDLEGRTARAFLEWAARERGLGLAFSDEAVARSAGEIVLSGTVERLTLEQALDAVLPTCRMVFRVEEGLLKVAAAPEPRTGA